MKRLLFILAIALTGCATAPTRVSAPLEQVVVLQTETGVPFCSGVAITPVRVLTAKHCVEGITAPMNVRMSDGRVLKVVSSKTSDIADAAILVVDAPVLKPGVLGDPRKLQVGDLVIAAGHPRGHVWTVTHGYVANLMQKQSDENAGYYTMHTAPIFYGSSGGPLFNAAGEVIGLNAWGYVGSGLNFSLVLTNEVLASVQ